MPRHLTSLTSSTRDPRLQAIVAIPARNERDNIENCLDALSRQEGLRPGSLGILLFLNNCSDGTREVAEAFAASMPWALKIVDVTFASATAGWARRQAMDAASGWLGPNGAGGVLLTTDADSKVPPGWVAKNMDYIECGADLVAGRIALDPNDSVRLPASLHARGRLEAGYEQLLMETGARLDPDPGNPWPCHWTKSGATIAVRHDVYERAGGMPAIGTGEDRAFVDAVRALDLVVRHPVDIEVMTSGRLEGRAAGGVADTIRLRCEKPDSLCDDKLEPLHRFVRRVAWCRRLRVMHRHGVLRDTGRWDQALGIPRSQATTIAAMACFGAAHAAIEAASPQLAYNPLRPAQLPAQIRYARVLVTALRWRDLSWSARDQAGIRPFETDEAAATI